MYDPAINERINKIKLGKLQMDYLVGRLVSNMATNAASAMALRDPEDAQGGRSHIVDLINSEDLHVILVGTGSPLVQEGRVGPCTAVVGAGHFFLVDCGPASFRSMRFIGLPLGRLSGILLTHFHSDHIGDLGEVMTNSWLGGRVGKTQVYGPKGVHTVVDGYSQAYRLDQGYRTAHHGADLLPPETHGFRTELIPEVPEGQDNVTIFHDGETGFTIKAFEVNHAPVSPAYGVRFELGARSVVVSGDTCKCSSLVQNAKHCDLLVQEAISCEVVGRIAKAMKDRDHPNTNRTAKFLDDIVDYHTPVQEALEIAAEACVKEMVFTHLVPTPANQLLESFFLAKASKPPSWDGNVSVGADGMIFTVREGNEVEMISEGTKKRINPARAASQIGAALAVLGYFMSTSKRKKKAALVAAIFSLGSWLRSERYYVAKM